MAELGLLTALALIIFVVELQIPNPVPIPGVKLGLANIIMVFAVYYYRAREVFLVVVSRILLGSFLGGNMMAFLYSIAGGLLCLAGMLFLKHVITEKYIWLCSVLGAVLHNIGQITIACLIASISPFSFGFRLYRRRFYRRLRTTRDTTKNPPKYGLKL